MTARSPLSSLSPLLPSKSKTTAQLCPSTATQGPPSAAHVSPGGPSPFPSLLWPPPSQAWPLRPGGHLGAGEAVAMLLTERAQGRHQHQQGPASPVVPAVGPTLAQVAGGAGQAPAAALVGQAAQAGGVGGAGRRAVGLQEEEGDLLGKGHRSGAVT